MADRKRLGKGLDSLIPGGGDPPAEAGIEQIPLRKVEVNPKQPRQDIDQEGLERLAESIRTSGIIQPVVVRRRGEMFELAVGERRMRAAKIAGIEQIPAVVREISDQQMLAMALVENIQREDLNPMDKANAIRNLMRELEANQEQVGAHIGMARPTVANFLRLLELPEQIQQMLRDGSLTAGHARALLAIEGVAEQIEAAEKIAEQGLSVRQAEKIAAGPKKTKEAPEKSPHLQNLEKHLEEALGAEVSISKRGQAGRITVHFNGHEEFERILETITGREAGHLAKWLFG